MIQIYSAENTDFTRNGNAVLHPTAASAKVQINGTWQATLEHPVDETGVWEYITEQAVIKMPFYNGEQLFRIYQVTKSDFNVRAYAYPIFYDSANDCFLVDVRPTNRTGQQALNIMMESNPKYIGFSDIMDTATAYYEYKNLMEALNGSDDNSFVNRWGGEIEFDNYHVTINERIGADNGLEFRYGKNLNGISQMIDTSGVVTRIYPKAYNGRKLSTGGGYVDSAYISKYPTIKTKTITFGELVLSADATEDMIGNPAYTICEDQAALDAALIEKCTEQFTEANIDVPKVTITLSNVVDLSQVEGYEGLTEPIHLGDTVHLYHEIIGIRQEARIISLTYDAIRECVTALVIGEPEANYFNQLSSAMQKVNLAIRDDGTLRGENLVGLLDLSKANLYQMYDAAERSDKPAILFENNDPESDLYGAMGIGTQGFMISKEKTEAGEWIWSTWGTARGLVATAIVAGILSDRYGRNYWNLDTGEFALSASTTVGGSTVQELIDAGASEAVGSLTQEDVFNLLTDYGKVQGLWMQDGQLYMNASYLASGYIAAGLIAANSIEVSKLTGRIANNGWILDLDNGTLILGNINANQINAGTLNVDRIGSNSVAIDKLTGEITNGNWSIDLTNGTLTIGNISANNITTGTLSAARIAANSIAVSKLTGAIANGNWKIDLDAGTLTIGELNAEKITAGTLSAARIASNSIGVGKLSGSISKDGWILDLTNGTLTIGTLSANKITSGEMSADRISGGTLKLGGSGNGNGVLEVYNASGTLVGRLNNAGLYAIAGTIGGFVIGSSDLHNGMTSLDDTTHNGIWLGTNGIALGRGKFKVTNSGVLTAKEVSLNGAFETVNTNGTAYAELTTGGLEFGNLVSGAKNMTGSISGGSYIRVYSAYNTELTALNFLFSTHPSGSTSATSVYSIRSDSSSYVHLFTGNVRMNNGLSVTGTKSRVVQTEDYSERLLYAYETPSPLFGDVGEGQLGEDGLAYVWLDPIFAETISTSQYQVFLQKYGAGDCWIKKRRASCFIVEGTPGLAFGWELKAKQADFDQKRLDNSEEYTPTSEINYADEAVQYLSDLREGRVA